MKPGEKAVIKFIDEPEIALKLMEMGFIPGERIVLSKKAPLGCPLSIAIGSDELSLRIEEANHVWIESD